MKPDENAKNPDRQVPMKLSSVKPEDYAKSIPSANGSAAKNAGKETADGGPPDYTLPGHPTDKGNPKP